VVEEAVSSNEHTPRQSKLTSSRRRPSAKVQRRRRNQRRRSASSEEELVYASEKLEPLSANLQKLGTKQFPGLGKNTEALEHLKFQYDKLFTCALDTGNPRHRVLPQPTVEVPELLLPQDLEFPVAKTRHQKMRQFLAITGLAPNPSPKPECATESEQVSWFKEQQQLQSFEESAIPLKEDGTNSYSNDMLDVQRNPEVLPSKPSQEEEKLPLPLDDGNKENQRPQCASQRKRPSRKRAAFGYRTKYFKKQLTSLNPR
jgi:hypothetical protein